MSLEFITTHIADAKNRLIEQYKGKERIEATITALVEQVQMLEDVFQALNVERGIETAVGVQLDRIGYIVGREREVGQSDLDYRLLIKSKIIQNLNQGTPEEVIAAAKFFLDAASVWYLEVFPAAVDIFTSTEIPNGRRARIRGLLEQFLPAAVSLDSFGHYDAQRPLIFSGGVGFGDTDDASVGDLFANLFLDAVSYDMLDEDGDEILTEDNDILMTG